MQVDGYRIEKVLGKGGMATVYLAVEETFDRQVALKVMSPALVADSTFAERFLLEARIVARLAHPNIVSVYQTGVSNNNYYLAMELHQGGDLSARIAHGMTGDEIIGVLRDIGAALNYAHATGYVHRDIKPGNVLFSEHGHAVLTDFGIAKAADASAKLTQVQRVVGSQPMTRAGAVVGTPAYMSPEQARGQSVDGPADIYSLGIVLFEMLTRRVPYEATDPIAVAVMHVNEPIPVLPNLYASFQSLLSRMLAKNPSERIKGGDELDAALDELALDPAHTLEQASDNMATTVIPTPAEPAGRGGGGLLIKRGAIASGVAVAVAVVAFAMVGRESSDRGDSDPPSLTPATTSSPTTTPAPQQDPRKRRIADLLADAELAIDQNHLSSPPGDNALEMYGQVLELDPFNRRAAHGKERVAERYLELAKAAVRKKNPRLARRHVDRVADFAPAHPDLAAVELLVSREEKRAREAPTAGIKNELKILGLLGQARTALESDRLMSPKGKNAYDKYTAVLAIDPNHQKALEGVQRIASRYLELAQASLVAGDREQARSYLDKASQVAPRHPDLPAARRASKR